MPDRTCSVSLPSRAFMENCFSTASSLEPSSPASPPFLSAPRQAGAGEAKNPDALEHGRRLVVVVDPIRNRPPPREPLLPRWTLKLDESRYWMQFVRRALDGWNDFSVRSPEEFRHLLVLQKRLELEGRRVLNGSILHPVLASDFNSNSDPDPGDKTRTTLLRDLLKLGLDPNVQNLLDETPLHLAVRNNLHPNVFRLLRDAGADTQMRNNNGVLPVDVRVIVRTYSRVCVPHGTPSGVGVLKAKCREALEREKPSFAELAAAGRWSPVLNRARRRNGVQAGEWIQLHEGKTAIQWAEEHGKANLAAELKYLREFWPCVVDDVEFFKDVESEALCRLDPRTGKAKRVPFRPIVTFFNEDVEENRALLFSTPPMRTLSAMQPETPRNPVSAVNGDTKKAKLDLAEQATPVRANSPRARRLMGSTQEVRLDFD